MRIAAAVVATVRSLLPLVALALAFVAPRAFADAVAIRAGTTGFGAEYGYALDERFGLRGAFHGGSITRTLHESGVRYDAKMRFSTGFALFDFFPGAGRFRLSAGAAYNGNRLDVTAGGSSGTIEVNGRDYNIADVGTITGRMTFNKANPYLGVGWGSAARAAGEGVFFSADLGILFANPRVSLNATCSAALSTAQCNQFQSDLRAEEDQFKDSVGFRNRYPVLSFGIGYRW